MNMYKKLLRHKKGFTLIEALAGIAIIAIIAGTIATLFPLNIKVVEKASTEVEISAIASSIKDAIITGARENYNPDNKSFYFIFEGVAVMVNLPQIGTITTFPGDRDKELMGKKRQGIPVPDNAILGLYPSGLLYKGWVMEVYRVGGTGTTARLPELRFMNDENGDMSLDSYIGLPIDEDINLNDGTITASLDINKNAKIDTFEDVGLDGKRDEYEAGYHSINNPDPSGDNYDPVNNPFGTERNGRFDAEPFTDINGNGLFDPGEPFTDINGNGRFDEADINDNGYLDIPDMKPDFAPKTYLHDHSSRITNYGYTLAVMVFDQDAGFDNNIFIFEIAIYKDFFKARQALQSASQDILDAAGLRESDITDGKDNDGDGAMDAMDMIITDAENKIIGKPHAIPEITLNGVDDDGDTFIDDGLVKPEHVERFQIAF